MNNLLLATVFFLPLAASVLPAVAACERLDLEIQQVGSAIYDPSAAIPERVSISLRATSVAHPSACARSTVAIAATLNPDLRFVSGVHSLGAIFDDSSKEVVLRGGIAELHQPAYPESFLPGVRVADVARKHGTTHWQVYGWHKRPRDGRLSLPEEVAEQPRFARLLIERRRRNRPRRCLPEMRRRPSSRWSSPAS